MLGSSQKHRPSSPCIVTDILANERANNRTSAGLHGHTNGEHINILGTLVFWLRDRTQSWPGDVVLEATQIAPTIWPLIFSQIVGSMIRTLAHRRIRRGATVGLMGSQTVLGTLFKGIELRLASLVTVPLLIVWGLSPLGGQAILRSIERVMVTETTLVPLSYMALDPRASDSFDVRPGRSSSTNSANAPEALFGTAILSTAASLHELNNTRQASDFERIISSLGGVDAAIQASRRDVWNHARIPIVDLLPGFDQQRFNDGQWLEVPNDRVVSYSSSFGVPVFNLPIQREGNMSFSIQTSYTRFRCEDWMTGDEFERYWNRTEDSLRSLFVGSEPPLSFDSSGSSAAHQFATTMPYDIPERPLLFHNHNNGIFPTRYGAHCYPRVVYVEADMRCSRASGNGQVECAALRNWTFVATTTPLTI
ncbi:hypothetical protein B0I35DRAFT_412335 [Stachybotrys elegans]|uniref:Uncharacterized protein n=1 Tax=Stachybotrys elegans TaxID=80388 RepID=A0A8K0WMU0_9HYPO|nr:hypothetical protein B0I35DRAFT_412335 [Stachybotrys elegans]